VFQNRFDIVLQQPDEEEGDGGIEGAEGPVGGHEGLCGQDDEDDGENQAQNLDPLAIIME
jgi:hypothetical protein